jgi:hypothetical protein
VHIQRFDQQGDRTAGRQDGRTAGRFVFDLVGIVNCAAGTIYLSQTTSPFLTWL